MSIGETAQPAEQPHAPPAPGLWPITGYFLKLGTIGFGGPAALVGYMHRDLVERRGWIDEHTYQLAMALAQIMPGPLAAQCAIAIGYFHARHARRHVRRAGVRPAVVRDGRRPLDGVRRLWWPVVDAGAVLRHRRRGHRHYRDRRV